MGQQGPKPPVRQFPIGLRPMLYVVTAVLAVPSFLWGLWPLLYSGGRINYPTFYVWWSWFVFDVAPQAIWPVLLLSAYLIVTRQSAERRLLKWLAAWLLLLVVISSSPMVVMEVTGSWTGDVEPKPFLAETKQFRNSLMLFGFILLVAGFVCVFLPEPHGSRLAVAGVVLYAASLWLMPGPDNPQWLNIAQKYVNEAEQHARTDSQRFVSLHYYAIKLLALVWAVYFVLPERWVARLAPRMTQESG